MIYHFEYCVITVDRHLRRLTAIRVLQLLGLELRAEQAGGRRHRGAATGNCHRHLMIYEL